MSNYGEMEIKKMINYNKELKRELRDFESKEKGKTSYFVYFVEYDGIKIVLKPNDATARQFLEKMFEDEAKAATMGKESL